MNTKYGALSHRHGLSNEFAGNGSSDSAEFDSRSSGSAGQSNSSRTSAAEATRKTQAIGERYDSLPIRYSTKLNGAISARIHQNRWRPNGSSAIIVTSERKLIPAKISISVQRHCITGAVPG